MIALGIKSFVLKPDDPNYREYDYILLQEEIDGKLSSREILCRITHVLRDAPDLGLKKDFAVIGFKVLRRKLN